MQKIVIYKQNIINMYKIEKKKTASRKKQLYLNIFKMKELKKKKIIL